MGIIRPATPGFLVTLVATILLAVVSFCVPYFKTIFFLKAAINVDNVSGNITFGTLGYCLELTSGTKCSKPSIGYELDINGLVGNKLPIEIPQVAVKWLTYALFLHVIALAAAAASALFGLLAHIREMSMTCCSTFISGFAAVIAMFAFIFDLALFFVAKARINKVGTASMGNAIWLTLAAWLLLFFSGCFYSLGRCCITNRPRAPGGGSYGDGNKWGNRDPEAISGPNKDPTNLLRLDAVKAEADRKARQKIVEGGLPAFGSETHPLTGRVEGDQVYFDGDENGSNTHLATSAAPPARQQQAFSGGYVPGAPGTRAMDDYYNPPANNTYPPQSLHRQPSSYAPSTYTANSIPPTSSAQQYAAGYGAYNTPMTTSPPPSNQLLAIPGQYPQDQYGREYGHTAGGTSYHTAASHHEQQPSSYSHYDPYRAQSPPQQQAHYIEPPYNPPLPTGAAYAPHNTYYSAPSSPPPQQLHQNERSYTLSGDGYGASSVPPLQDGYGNNSIPPLQGYSNSPGGYYGAPALHAVDTTNVGYGHQPQGQTSPVKGPRTQQPSTIPEEAPPGYDPGMSNVTGNWGKH